MYVKLNVSINNEERSELNANIRRSMQQLYALVHLFSSLSFYLPHLATDDKCVPCVCIFRLLLLHFILFVLDSRSHRELDEEFWCGESHLNWNGLCLIKSFLLCKSKSIRNFDDFQWVERHTNTKEANKWIVIDLIWNSKPWISGFIHWKRSKMSNNVSHFQQFI